jgi:hypothetical protein
MRGGPVGGVNSCRCYSDVLRGTAGVVEVTKRSRAIDFCIPTVV